MKKLLLIFLVFISHHTFSQDETIQWREIPSITEWIKEINNWPKETYNVQNIRILINPIKDSLFVDEPFPKEPLDTTKIAATINKKLRIKNWQILNTDGRSGGFAMKNIRFKDTVRLSEYDGVTYSFANMIFEKYVRTGREKSWQWINHNSCWFKENLTFYDLQKESGIGLRRCIIDEGVGTIRGNPSFIIQDSEISEFNLSLEYIDRIFARSTKFKTIDLTSANIETAVQILDSKIGSINVSGAVLPEKNTYIPFQQIEEKVFVNPIYLEQRSGSKKYFANDTIDFNNQEVYHLLLSSYKILQDVYQNRGDQDSYNASYIEMKNLETRRLEFLFNASPNFKSFFTWKINQFLKVFSAYGTEPARAIIVSLYVILFFALIYLLFPNTWDTLGNKRLMHRFEFFQKYLRRKEGMHTLYLEGKQQEISSYEDFKTNLEKAHLELPSFFITWSKPLYSASMFSSRLMTRFLKSTDVLQGKWQDLSPKQKRWKNIQIGFLLTIGLFYDLFIKILNALMLSINTFTTLGFGEIPIKGLPRYLAIIQGFIGWFMLTIFSVSLISQLLN